MKLDSKEEYSMGRNSIDCTLVANADNEWGNGSSSLDELGQQLLSVTKLKCGNKFCYKQIYHYFKLGVVSLVLYIIVMDCRKFSV